MQYDLHPKVKEALDEINDPRKDEWIQNLRKHTPEYQYYKLMRIAITATEEDYERMKRAERFEWDMANNRRKDSGLPTIIHPDDPPVLPKENELPFPMEC